MESTHNRLREARVKVHTVMVVPEKNPSMESLSESFTALDIQPDVSDAGGPASDAPAALQPRVRLSYRI